MKANIKGLYLLMVTSFSLSIASNAIIPIQPLFIVDLGATEFELGLIFTVSSLLGMLFRIPLGILSDRFGRKKMIVIASLINLASLVSFSLVDNVVWFYPLMILHAMIWGFFAPSAVSLASDTASIGRVGAVFGLYYTSIGLGQFMGPLLSGVLTEYVTYREIFASLSIFPVVGLLAITQWKSMDGTGKTFGSEHGYGKVDGRILDSFKRIFRSRNMLGLCLSRITFSIPSAIIGIHFPVWARTELFFTPLMISTIFSVRGAANSAFRIPSGKIVDKIGKKKPIILAYFLASIVFIIFSLFRDFNIILIAMLLYGLAWALRVIPDTTILTESVEPRDKGLALAILMSMFAVGRSLGSFVGGISYVILPMHLLFQISAGILLLGIVILVITIN